MSAVLFRVRARVRGGRRVLLALIVVIGLAGGAVLGAAVGARRTQTAYPRFIARANAHDVLLSGQAETGLRSGFYEAAARLPEVEASDLGVGVVFRFPGRTVPASFGTSPTFADIDGGSLRSVDRFNVIEGRLPRPGASDEVVVNKAFADGIGLHAGETLRLQQLADQADPASEPFTVTVTGVGLPPGDIIAVSALDGLPTMAIPPAVTRAHVNIDARGFDGMLLSLRQGTDIAAFEARVRALAERFPALGGVFFASEAERPAIVQRALRPQVYALGVFAVLTAITMLLAVGQILIRQVRLDADEATVLGAMGMSRRQLFAVNLIPAAMASFMGAGLATIIAVGSSAFTPIGPARLAEPEPGIEVNVAMLGIGAVVIVLVLVLIAAVPAWRTARVGGEDNAVANRPSVLARTFARAGATPSAAIGVRLALEPGRGRTAVPVHTTLVGTIAAAAAIVASFTFGSSLEALVTTPRLYGQTWNIVADTQFGIVPPSLIAAAKADPAVEAAAGGTYGLISARGTTVPAIGLDVVKGDELPALSAGRRPAGDDEIALGSTSARRLGVDIGDVLDIGSGEERRAMRVVGTAVFPRLGQGSFTPTGLGEGAAVTAAAMRVPGLGPGQYNYVMLRTTGPLSPALAREIESLCALVTESGNECTPSMRPADLDNYARMRGTPFVLASLSVALALATLSHGLVTSVSRRRRDLSVLKTLGFTRGQVSSSVAWQATTVLVLALLVGIPLGVAGGRLSWNTFANRLGVLPESRTPLAAILGAAALTIVLGNLIAALPARTASKTQPAVVLRSE